jgi:hypothetical protein
MNWAKSHLAFPAIDVLVRKILKTVALMPERLHQGLLHLGLCLDLRERAMSIHYADGGLRVLAFLSA